MDWPDRDRLVAIVSVTLVVLAVGIYLFGATGPLGWVLYPVRYEHATVTAVDRNGTTLTTVDVRVADNSREQYIGLSHTDSLQRGEGMLFVFDGTDTRTFVMRDMNFPLDIVFADGSGAITTIHHAPVPSKTSGSDLRHYPGRARYVLEVPRGYTNATGIDVGDRIVVPGRVAR